MITIEAEVFAADQKKLRTTTFSAAYKRDDGNNNNNNKNETIPEKVFEEVCRHNTFAFPEGCTSLTPRENGGQTNQLCFGYNFQTCCDKILLFNARYIKLKVEHYLLFMFSPPKIT